MNTKIPMIPLHDITMRLRDPLVAELTYYVFKIRARNQNFTPALCVSGKKGILSSCASSNQIYTGPVSSASILIHLSLNEDLWGRDNNERRSNELFVWKPSNRLKSCPTIYQVSPELHPWSGELDRMPLRSGFLSLPEGKCGGQRRSSRNWLHTGDHKPTMAYIQNSHNSNRNCSHNNMLWV